MADSYIIAASRTPIGKLSGTLASLSAPELGALAIKSVISTSNINSQDVDEVIMGNVLSAGLGQAPARQAAIKAGLPTTVAALTINKVCGSGLKAVMLADQAIRAGDASCIISGGMESMSNAPHLLKGSRTGYKFGHQQLIDSMLHDGLWCAFENVAMGEEAEYIAKKHGITRVAQDEMALESHRRAILAQSSGWFEDEICPVVIESRKGNITIETDEGPRANSSLESLGKLRPAFDATGTVTAGNASQISDGAAAVVVVDHQLAEASDSAFKARIVASATAGVDPKEIFIAPVDAINMVLKKAKMTLEQIDLIELNEAFAAQCLACEKGLDLDHEKTNVVGGGIALGHPIGASGARVLVTLLHSLKRLGKQYGLASLCLGGGNAVALIIELQ